ncbi:unnamed protein product [marine sediment metagenome]|uniref:Uncharacterized protein n=1 Tax=marine sediment metagenome TaxID=412755 RepID=X1QM19_9ZZZZ
MVYFQALDASATTGTTDYDDGLRSTAENPKRLLSVLLIGVVLGLVGSMVQIWYEQELIAELPIFLIDNLFASAQVEPYSKNRINEIEVGFDIPVGAIVKVAIKAVGGTQTIVGAYRYEITA